MAVDFSKDAGVGFITLANPPANSYDMALSRSSAPPWASAPATTM